MPLQRCREPQCRRAPTLPLHWWWSPPPREGRWQSTDNCGLLGGRRHSSTKGKSASPDRAVSTRRGSTRPRSRAVLADVAGLLTISRPRHRRRRPAEVVRSRAPVRTRPLPQAHLKTRSFWLRTAFLAITEASPKKWEFNLRERDLWPPRATETAWPLSMQALSSWLYDDNHPFRSLQQAEDAPRPQERPGTTACSGGPAPGQRDRSARTPTALAELVPHRGGDAAEEAEEFPGPQAQMSLSGDARPCAPRGRGSPCRAGGTRLPWRPPPRCPRSPSQTSSRAITGPEVADVKAPLPLCLAHELDTLSHRLRSITTSPASRWLCHLPMERVAFHRPSLGKVSTPSSTLAFGPSHRWSR